MKADRVLSRQVVQGMDAPPKVGDCYHNAFVAIPSAADVTGSLPRFVVGRVFSVLAPDDTGLAHGWLEAQDGRVIDVTPFRKEPPHPDVLRYVAVRRMTVHEVLDYLDANDNTFTVLAEELEG